MQKEPIHLSDPVPNCTCRQTFVPVRSIEFVSYDRVSDMSKMNPDLMGPACLGENAAVSEAGVLPDHLVAG